MKDSAPSNTALIVAAGLQLSRHLPGLDRVLPHEAIALGARVLQRAHPRMAAMLGKPWFVRLSSWLERATLPGFVLHLALRKRRLRDLAQGAVGEGCRQVVVLGAGFDTLCMELQAAYPQLACFEIDHPATQRVKRAAAASDAHGVTFLAVDLAQRPLAEVLAACPQFDPEVPTLFVAEGLLMYVPLPAVATLFEQIAQTGPQNRVAFTWLSPQADGKPNFSKRSRLIDAWLAVRGEPFLSGMAPASLPAFLNRAGMALVEVAESAAVLEAAEPLANRSVPLAGEYVAFAKVRGSQLPEK